MARDMFLIHLPALDRPEGGKTWKLLHATITEVLSKLSARPFFPLPSGPLMPALPLCTTASIIRREWVAFSRIMPCVLVLVASIGALVLVAAVLSKFSSGSKAPSVGFATTSALPSNAEIRNIKSNVWEGSKSEELSVSK